MADALDLAIEKLRDRSPERRDVMADIIESYIEDGSIPFELSEQERALLDEGLAELDRGEVATAAEVEAIYAKYRRP